MAARYSRFFSAIHIIGDIFLLNFAFFIGNSIYYDSISVSFDEHYVKQFLYINLFWGVSASINRIYDIYRVARIESIIMTLLRTFILHLLLCFSFIIFFKEQVISYRLFATKYTLFIFFIASWRIGFVFMLKMIRKRGLNFRNVIILGNGPIAQEAYQFFLSHPEHGYQFNGFFTPGITTDQIQLKTNLEVEEIKNFLIENNIDEIYCSMQEINHNIIHDLMKFSDDNLIRFKLLPDFRGFQGKKMEINFYDHIPVLMARKEPLDNLLNRIGKRTFDILFSLLVIVLVFPWLFPLVIIAIKISSKGPVLFKQKRSGLNNSPFTCLKFRTMITNNSAPEIQASKNDPRITRVGSFLRKSSLDEMPQFFNVLVGDMSIVGPRPHMIEHTEKYSRIIEGFMVRHFVKPGITGQAQIKGFRGETSEPEMMQKRVEQDVWYIENWSFFLDLKIIFLTVFNIFKGDSNAV